MPRARASSLLVVLCRIAQIGVIQLDTTPTERILYSLCRAESGVRPCTEIGANGQPDKALLAVSADLGGGLAPPACQGKPPTKTGAVRASLEECPGPGISNRS